MAPWSRRTSMDGGSPRRRRRRRRLRAHRRARRLPRRHSTAGRHTSHRDSGGVADHQLHRPTGVGVERSSRHRQDHDQRGLSEQLDLLRGEGGRRSGAGRGGGIGRRGARLATVDLAGGMAAHVCTRLSESRRVPGRCLGVERRRHRRDDGRGSHLVGAPSAGFGRPGDRSGLWVGGPMRRRWLRTDLGPRFVRDADRRSSFSCWRCLGGGRGPSAALCRRQSGRSGLRGWRWALRLGWGWSCDTVVWPSRGHRGGVPQHRRWPHLVPSRPPGHSGQGRRRLVPELDAVHRPRQRGRRPRPASPPTGRARLWLATTGGRRGHSPAPTIFPPPD